MEISPARAIQLAQLCGHLARLKANARSWTPEYIETVADEAYVHAATLRRELCSEDSMTQSLKRSLRLYERIASTDYDY